MSVPIPSTSHAVGDTGHTSDHDNIATVLNTFLASITALQAITGNIFYTVGGNFCNIPGTTTPFARVNLPSGNRDSASDTISVFYGTSKVFSLNGYGEIRLVPGAAGHVAAIIQGLPSQTGDLFQFKDSSGNVLARVAADGTISGPAVRAVVSGSVETWHPVVFSNGWSNSGSGANAQYRMLASPPNSVEIIGDVNGGTTADGTAMFTLPSAYRPNTTQVVCPLIIPNNSTPFGPRLTVQAAGNVQTFGVGGLITPRLAFHGVISLDA